jgi:hypothetical protein
MSEVRKSPVEWYAKEHKKFREEPWKYVNNGGEEAILKQAKEMEELRLIKVLAEQSTKEAAKTKELLDFLNAQISKNRSYSASTMCQVIIEFIKNQHNK